MSDRDAAIVASVDLVDALGALMTKHALDRVEVPGCILVKSRHKVAGSDPAKPRPKSVAEQTENEILGLGADFDEKVNAMFEPEPAKE
jgi:hypothetical protein